jgi:N-acetylmuramoyl-L-alanine amidase
MHRTIKNKYARFRKGVEYTGTVSSRDLHVLREVIPTPVFVEVANIQNSFDLQRILSPKNRQLLADWLAEGLMNDY